MILRLSGKPLKQQEKQRELQILYALVTLLDVSVDQFFFPKREQEKSTRRRQLDTMLDTMSETDLKIMSATAKGIEEANNDRTGE